MKLIHDKWPCSCWNEVYKTEDGAFRFIRPTQNGERVWCCTALAVENIQDGYGPTVRAAMIDWKRKTLGRLREMTKAITDLQVPAIDEEVVIVESNKD